MPGQFINTGTNPNGKLSLINVNDEGNFSLNIKPLYYYQILTYIDCANSFDFRNVKSSVPAQLNYFYIINIIDGPFTLTRLEVTNTFIPTTEYPDYTAVFSTTAYASCP